MSGDELFPFPEPDFVFVHEVWCFPPRMQNSKTDERGKVLRSVPQRNADGQYLDESGNVIPPIKGYLTSPNAQRDLSGYTQRQGIDAVLLVPHSAVVDHDWLVACHDPSLPAHLDGVYSIDSVRPNISHTRVLVKRNRLQWQAKV